MYITTAIIILKGHLKRNGSTSNPIFDQALELAILALSEKRDRLKEGNPAP